MKIGVTGVTGRIGSGIARLLIEGAFPDLELAGGLVRPGSVHTGMDIGTLANISPCGGVATDDPARFIEISDCIVDFSTPAGTHALLTRTKDRPRPLVIGTTGLDADTHEMMADLSSDRAIVYATNMSSGVTLLRHLVRECAAALGEEFDIEILERHHRNKKDAPSGTALTLGEDAAKARGWDRRAAAPAHDRNTNGPRPGKQIGYAVQRGGDIVGDHVISFISAGEEITLGHRAGSRDLFARGALQAAQWIADKPPRLYSMEDVLGLNR